MKLKDYTDRPKNTFCNECGGMYVVVPEALINKLVKKVSGYYNNDECPTTRQVYHLIKQRYL